MVFPYFVLDLFIRQINCIQLERDKHDWRQLNALFCVYHLQSHFSCNGNGWLMLSRLWIQTSQKSFFDLTFLLSD